MKDNFEQQLSFLSIEGQRRKENELILEEKLT